MSFERFGLDAHIMKGIGDMGYKEPTPIQQQAIPLVVQGKDVLGLAQTGTGKTAAFVLPMLNHLLPSPRHSVRGLIISPTRELAEQTHESIEQLGAHTGLKSMVVYGGVNINTQKTLLKGGKAEIIVACPGRLLDHIGQGTVNLSHIEMLVLDEADRMLDMGFMPDIRRILKHIPKRRQALMFSATMPEDIRKLVRDVLDKDYETVQIGMSAPATSVSHVLYPVEKHLKTALLKALLAEAGDGPVLVFTRTRDKASRLGHQLKRAGFQSTSLEGGMTQSRRQAALEGFRSGEYRVLVATDVAARGIDVENITHVINYDIPENLDDYIHRVGRTGRASRTGEAWSIVTELDGPIVMNYERSLDVELVARELEGFDYAAVAAPFDDRDPGKGQRSHKTHSKRRESRGGESGGAGSAGGRRRSRKPKSAA